MAAKKKLGGKKKQPAKHVFYAYGNPSGPSTHPDDVKERKKNRAAFRKGRGRIFTKDW